jgi:uncharacterized membrane protein
MKKSKKCYNIAFIVSLTMIPFVIMTNIETLRIWWFTSTLFLLLVVMLCFTFRAIKLEERGE